MRPVQVPEPQHDAGAAALGEPGDLLLTVMVEARFQVRCSRVPSAPAELSEPPSAYTIVTLG